MNFINLIFKIQRIFFLCLSLLIHYQSFSCNTSALEHELIYKEIPLHNNIQDEKIKNVLFDDSGQLFLVTNNKVAIFNGNGWQFVTTKGESLLKKSADGIIYFLDQSGPGIIFTDSSLTYRKKYLFDKKTHFSNFYLYKDKILLVRGDSLFEYAQKKSDFLSKIEEPEKVFSSNDVLIYKNENTYHILKDSKTQSLNLNPEADLYYNEFDKSLFIFDQEDKTLGKLSGTEITPLFKVPFPGRLAFFFPMNENFVFVSDSGFLLVTNRSGKIIQRNLIPREILPEFDLKIIPSPYSDLFFVSDGSLYIVEFPSPFRKIIQYLPEIKKKEDLSSSISKELPESINKNEILFSISNGEVTKLFSDRNIYSFNEGENPIESALSPNLSSVLDIELLNDTSYLIAGLNHHCKYQVNIYNFDDKLRKTIVLPGFLNGKELEITSIKDSLVILYSKNTIYCLFPFYTSNFESPFTISSIKSGNQFLLKNFNYEDARAFIRNKLNSISYRNRKIMLTLSVCDFVPGIHQHQYKINKDHNKWSDWEYGNTIRFDDLIEGDYEIELRIKNPDGDISRIQEIRFTILPPVYRMWYAYVLYFFILIFLLFFIYKSFQLWRHRISTEPEEDNHPVIYHKEDVPEEPKKYEFITNLSGNDQKSKKNKWDKYEMATVLFSDIQGFTKIAEQTNPEVLIDELDKFFFHFDSVVEKYHIEKIKTIGDAYMAAGGIPKKNSSNPIEVVLASLEMQQYMKQLKNSRTEIWDLRIGIHSGPVIAGVVGQKKRSYDIWGDTVNTASRMESSGEAGKVNISDVTHNLVKDYFLCDYRGKLPVKYKGNIDMYFVKGLRPELSINLAGIPNRKFFLKMQLLKLQDLEDHVFNKLEEEQPQGMYFHNVEYARHVYQHSDILAKAENLDLEETLLIRTSALLLFLGYTIGYFGSEKLSSQLALELLGEFGYSEKQTSTISNLILATKMPAEPKNLLEKVIIDTSLEYLGRADYIKIYKLLFLEYNEYNKPVKTSEWKEMQIDLLKSHQYFTSGGRRLREISAEKQIQRIEEDVW